MTAFMLLVILATTIWLGIDAGRRDWTGSSFARSAGVWVFGSLAMWIVIFPLYLVMRARVPLKHQ
jgi:hypothetical protein